MAIGGSLLIFHGREVVAGTNRFAGATGRVVSSKEVEGGSDVVVRVTRAAKPPGGMTTELRPRSYSRPIAS